MFASHVSSAHKNSDRHFSSGGATHCHGRRRQLRLLGPSSVERRRTQSASGGARRPPAAVALETSISVCFRMCETDAPAVSRCAKRLYSAVFASQICPLGPRVRPGCAGGRTDSVTWTRFTIVGKPGPWYQAHVKHTSHPSPSGLGGCAQGLSITLTLGRC